MNDMKNSANKFEWFNPICLNDILHFKKVSIYSITQKKSVKKTYSLFQNYKILILVICALKLIYKRKQKKERIPKSMVV